MDLFDGSSGFYDPLFAIKLRIDYLLTIDLFDLRLPFEPSILRVTYPLS
jgi:hypothetical protein